MNRAEKRLSCRLPRLHHTTLEDDTMKILLIETIILAGAFACIILAGATVGGAA